mgnify:CR=1 FL=1
MMKFSLPTAFGKKVSLVIGLVVLSAFQAQAFDKAHLLNLKAVKACVECDLRGATLTGANLFIKPRHSATLFSASRSLSILDQVTTSSISEVSV